MLRLFGMVLVLLVVGTLVDRVVAASNASVAEVFEADQVVPDVIPVAPQDLAVVKYANDIEVEPGQELTPTQVKDVPEVTWNATLGDFYTLVFVDADVPSREEPASRNLQHWLVVNIPGSNQTAGETLTEYIGSGPSLGSGLHRYVILVYRQPSVLNFTEPRLNNTSSADRKEFSVVNFAEKYNLSGPDAGNFYQAQYDDYVPILHEQLGISADNSSLPVVAGFKPLKFGIPLLLTSILIGVFL